MADEVGNQVDVFDDKLDNVSDNEIDPEAIFDPEIKNMLIKILLKKYVVEFKTFCL